MDEHDLSAAALARAHAGGAQGRAWLSALPGLAADLAREWELTLGGSLGGGSEASVREARMADGRAAVLKLVPPGRDPTEQELAVLLAAGGRGYAQVYAHDERRGALLLERLGPQLAQMGWSVDRQIAALCETLMAAWMAPPAGAGFQTGAEKARALSAFIAQTWEEMGRPCAERTIETAISYARLREAAFDPARAVLAHGDAHAWNALQAPGGEGFKFVDPDGLFIEPAYDLGIAMREWAQDLLAGDPVGLGARRCARLAALTGVEPEPIWQWGFMERTSTGLMALKLGMAEGREMLAVADAWGAGGLAD
ncbi:MAG: aminoglycoside phosphotransferase [Phenylobacterium sp.]|uniref:aminoglycoside phosphotransferase family protein n=1 Tax=Phenylobacterium sp. TaxID=1871053 RepID=UPI0025CCA07B|nr:aminoglycoside phosphotransferase family protein [Phenylobacterium sp.]MBA4013523.1 aminoglycoside phosphotransferase [Phenylobacterium sp.]